MKNQIDLRRALATTTLAALLGLAGCGGSDDHDHGADGDGHSHADGHAHDADDHDHDGDGHDADGHDHGDGDAHAGDDHDHDHGEEIALPSASIGDLTVELAQAHGPLQAGEEGHLVIKLPYTDNGATVVRAWIGTEDRTLSFVGRGEYAPSHDDYDVHAMAPDPLPADCRWWIEIEKPDGTKVLGSATPLMD